MMKIGILAVAALLLTSCALMSPQDQSTALEVLDQMLKQGSITPAQYEALKESVLNAGTTAWWQQAAQVILGAGLGYLGIQMKPPARVDNRKIAATQA